MPWCGWFVTLGSAGVVAPNPSYLEALWHQKEVEGPSFYSHYPAPVVDSIVSVTGAGDSFVAAAAASLLNADFDNCVMNGLRAAELSVQSNTPIARDLQERLSEMSPLRREGHRTI